MDEFMMTVKTRSKYVKARKFVANLCNDELFRLVDINSMEDRELVQRAVDRVIPKSKYAAQTIIQKDNSSLMCYVCAKSKKTYEPTFYEILLNVNQDLRRVNSTFYRLTIDAKEFNVVNAVAHRHMGNSARYDDVKCG